MLSVQINNNKFPLLENKKENKDLYIFYLSESLIKKYLSSFTVVVVNIIELCLFISKRAILHPPPPF